MKNNPIFYVFKEILDSKNSKLIALRLWLQFNGELDNKGNSEYILGFNEIQEIKTDLRIKYKEFRELLQEIYQCEACDVKVRINGEDTVIAELASSEAKLRKQQPSVFVKTYNLYKEKTSQKYIRITKKQYDFFLHVLSEKAVPSICSYIHMWLNIRMNVTYSDYVTDFLTLKKGECRTTHERLSCQTGLSDWQVRHTLSALVNIGLIKIVVKHKRYSQISLLNFVVEDEKLSKNEVKKTLQEVENPENPKKSEKESLDKDGSISKVLMKICRTAAKNNPEIENEKAIFNITYKKVMAFAGSQRIKAVELAGLIEDWFSSTKKCTVFGEELVSFLLEKIKQRKENIFRKAALMTSRIEAISVEDIKKISDEDVTKLYRVYTFISRTEYSSSLSGEEKRRILTDIFKEYTSLEIAARYFYLVKRYTCENSDDANRFDELLLRQGSDFCERIHREIKMLALRTTVSISPGKN